MFLLGYDIGSSSIKAALVDASTGKVIGMAQHPEQEMEMSAPHPDWAEQHPDAWWDAVCAATRKLLEKTSAAPERIAGIGIAYQMHGLVMTGKNGQVLRPAIIWCDSRAVGIGNQALDSLGADYCLEHYLNSPGNFTASKLRWVRENEPHIFEQAEKIMLPGDYIAYRMTGEICTTVTGLSEGILWDFKDHTTATRLLEYYGIPASMLPDIAPVFGQQGKLTAEAAALLGVPAGIPVGYRAGDQPNNALSLNVLRPGEVAATGGTSGVVYAVSKQPVYDPQQRVNSFAHVNYTLDNPLTGVLLCINGAGIQYSWIRQIMGNKNLTYPEMEQLASLTSIGADGLSMLSFGNGAERMLGNQNVGAQVIGLQFNRHNQRHLYRAALEGIAFAFVYGMEAMRDMGIPIQTLRVGNDNLFQSAVFSNTVASLVGANIEVRATTGAVGAAKASGVAAGLFTTIEEAMEAGKATDEVVLTYEPDGPTGVYEEAYGRWKDALNKAL